MKLINGISIQNYRGIHEKQTLELAEAGHITYLVGPNNSGKSIMARLFTIFETNFFEEFPNQKFFSLNNWGDEYFYDYNTDEPIEMVFDIDRSALPDDEIMKLSSHKFQHAVRDLGKLPAIRLGLRIVKGGGYYFCCPFLSLDDMDSHHTQVEDGRVTHNYNNFFKTSFGFEEDFVGNIVAFLFTKIRKQTLVFNSVRSFESADDSPFSISGSGLIEWLHRTNNRGEIKRAKEQIDQWLKKLNLEVPHAIRVDPEKKQLVFTFDRNLELSTSSIGTGFSMLLIMLMEIKRNAKRLIIIDEIESHLQPGLIRILISILKETQNVQYIIATHSSTVIDSSTNQDVFQRFRKEGRECRIYGFKRNWSADQNDRDAQVLREVCLDLGIIPGDALLSNTVIWVEGPSEVYWLRAWLKHYHARFNEKHYFSEPLIEGLHYSILMTGGNLLAHYAFKGEEVDLEEVSSNLLLQVLKVNPNPFVVMDWDNPKVNSKKWGRIFRVAEELNLITKSHPLFDNEGVETVTVDNFESIPNLWVLKGKELENYAHPQLLKEFYKKKAQAKNSGVRIPEKEINWDVFQADMGAGAILKGQQLEGIEDGSTLKHKLDFAKCVFDNFEEVHFDSNPIGIEEKPNPKMIDDLTKQLDKMIRYIRKANGMRIPRG